MRAESGVAMIDARTVGVGEIVDEGEEVGTVDGVSEHLIWGALGSAAISGSIGWRASQLGHVETTEVTGNRFRIVCSCGWRTDKRWTRRRTVLMASRHVFEVVYPPEPDPAKVVHPVTVRRIGDGVSDLAGGAAGL